MLHLSAPRFPSDSSSQVPAKPKAPAPDSTATIGFEAKRWLTTRITDGQHQRDERPSP